MRHALRMGVALTLLVVGAAVAQPDGVEASVAAREAAVFGSTTTNGPLAALVQENPTEYAPQASSGFLLEATRLRLETDRTNASVQVGSTGYRYDPHTVSREYVDATVQGVTHRPGYLFLVFPLGPVETSIQESSCALLEPSQEGVLARNARVIVDREPQEADTSQAMQWAGCADSANLTVSGDFLLRLWEWDAQITTPSGTESITSGRSAAGPAPEDQMHEAREQFLYATNATLHIPNLSGYYQLYLDAAATSAASVQFRDASVDVAGAVLEGQDMRLMGDLDLRLQQEDDALHGSLAGVEKALVDGESWTPSTVAPGGSSNASPWWLFVVAAGAGVAALAWRHPNRLARVASLEYDLSTSASSRRQRRGLGYCLMSMQANNQDRHRRSLFYAGRALALFPGLPEAGMMRGIALAHLGRHDQALTLLIDSYDALPQGMERAQAACVAALCCLRLGDRETAVVWLQRGFSEDAWFVLERVQRRAYNEIRDDPWLRMVTEGSHAVAREVHDAAAGNDAAFS